jgi:hypothetical protein
MDRSHLFEAMKMQDARPWEEGVDKRIDALSRFRGSRREGCVDLPQELRHPLAGWTFRDVFPDMGEFRGTLIPRQDESLDRMFGWMNHV